MECKITLNTQPIFNYIKNNNLTIKDFCEKCKINVSTFYRIINGKNCELVSLFKITKKIKVSIHMLFK